MSPALEEITKLIQETVGSKPRIALLEKAINIAETEKDFEKADDLREDLVWDAVEGGYPLKAIVAYSQRLKYADEHPDEVFMYSLIWSYKWILSQVPRFHQVSYQQIFDMAEDFKARVLAWGDNLSSYYTMRFQIALFMGDLEGLEEFYELRKKTPSGSMNDCTACVADDFVSYFSMLKSYEETEKEAADIIQGKRSCQSVPEATYKSLIKVALLDRKIEQAEKFRKKAYRLISKKEKYLGTIGYHMITHLIQGKESSALSLFKKHYNWSLNTANNGIAFFEFYLGAHLLFLQLMKKGQKKVKLSFEIEGVAEKMKMTDIAKLGSYFHQKTFELVHKFDQRNKNSFYREQADKYIAIFNS
ncbi:MAG: hypothetical protein R8P61_33895 [Bacteroidia bacterium]|nr:hypothetical protein [Bacteroidia bacterium]